MKTACSPDRGFTLLELLTVVGIIALLAALALPALVKTRDKARGVVCVNDLRQIGIGLSLYVSENGVYPRYGSLHNDDRRSYWDYALLAYVSGNKRAFHCPKVSGKTDEENWSFIQYAKDTDTNIFPNMSYGYNAKGTRFPDEIRLPSLGLSQMIKESALAAPAEMVAVADYNPLSDDDSDGDLHPDVLWGLTLTQERHGQRANVLFCDSHVVSAPTNWWRSEANRIKWNLDHQSH